MHLLRFRSRIINGRAVDLDFSVKKDEFAETPDPENSFLPSPRIRRKIPIRRRPSPFVFLTRAINHNPSETNENTRLVCTHAVFVQAIVSL